MDTLAWRQAKHTIQPQRLPSHKAEQSQTTIDLYLNPVTKARHGKNDIRNYFLPVAKTELVQNSERSRSRAPAKMRTTSKFSRDGNSATERQTSDPRPSGKVPLESTTSIPDAPGSSKTAPGVPIRPRNHTHANSAVLSNFDPLFDTTEFSHSTPPMAPRAIDIVRHSLLPKPLNIKFPLPPSAEPSVSPSQITSSPSSAGDADTASLDDEERGAAPSFKQTYTGVHSRHNTNDDGPISPLMALRDFSLRRPLHQRGERPAALRSKTVPLFSEKRYADSVIYFLPKISPTEESEVEERESLRESRYLKSLKKARAERQAVGFEVGGLGQAGKRRDKERQSAMSISPGLQRYYDYLASQKDAMPKKDKPGDRESWAQRKKGENIGSLDRTDEASSSKKKKKKGKGFLKLIEAYSRHVEGLQMIQ